MTDRSTFAQRFEYARDRQRALGTWQEDSDLAAQAGVAASRISEYKARVDAPGARRTLALAELCGVDPGWLAFGEASEAPAPDGWAAWLERRYPRQSPHEHPPPRVLTTDDLEPVPKPGKRRRRRAR